jgi:hypothetical protein
MSNVSSEEINWKQYSAPIEGECNLGKEMFGDQCCCVCRYLLTDYWHCRRMPEQLKPAGKCGCSVIRGYICTAGEIYEGMGGSSGWPHHSMGCECFDLRKVPPARVMIEKEVKNG